jgi:hypothetical protein
VWDLPAPGHPRVKAGKPTWTVLTIVGIRYTLAPTIMVGGSTSHWCSHPIQVVEVEAAAQMAGAPGR